jgi:formate hydrogenlyase transcriptional activator
MDNNQFEDQKTHSRQFEVENTEDKRAEEDLRERLHFEQLLSDLSARFVNIGPDQVDLEIESALRQILEFFQVDRCGLVHQCGP